MRLQRRCIQKPNYTNCIYKRLNTASPQSILTNPALPSFPIQILAIRNIFPFLRISFYQSITPPFCPVHPSRVLRSPILPSLSLPSRTRGKNTPKFNAMPSTALPKPVPMSPSQSILAIMSLKTQKSTQRCSCPFPPALNGYTPPRASRSLSKRPNR